MYKKLQCFNLDCRNDSLNIHDKYRKTCKVQPQKYENYIYVERLNQ